MAPLRSSAPGLTGAAGPGRIDVRGPTPVSGAQDRGSNAGARRVVGKLLAKLRFRRRPKVIAIEEPLKVPKVVDESKLCDGVYGKECALAAVTRCVFCGRNVCAKHTHYVGEEYGDYCSECYNGLTTIDDEFDDDED
jgi:hypothetical protein